MNLTGRRLIDLSLLAKELWCKSCNTSVSVRHATQERRVGLASIFHVTCQLCQTGHQVHMSNTEKTPEFSNVSYTVNTKVIVGK